MAEGIVLSRGDLILSTDGHVLVVGGWNGSSDPRRRACWWCRNVVRVSYGQAHPGTSVTFISPAEIAKRISVEEARDILLQKRRGRQEIRD